MFLISNLDCFPVSFKGKSARIPFEKKTLDGQFIHACFVFSSEEDCVILNPFNGNMITQLFDNEHLHFYLSLNNGQKGQTAENAPLNDAFFSIRNYNLKFNPLQVNAVFDAEKTVFISESDYENAEANTLIYFTWGKAENKNFDPKLSGNQCFQLITNDNTSTPLSDFIDTRKMEGKKIKKINCVINEAYSPAYLDIFCKDGRRMSYVPASLLQLPDEHGIFFDDIEIDWEKSRFLIPTFNEKQYNYTLTFGW